MIKAVLFDLDGTLLNRDLSVREFICDQYHRFYRFLGHIPKEKYVSKFIELDCRGYVWKDKVYEQLVNEFNIHTITPEQLLEDYITQFKNSCVPYPNLIEMLEMLKDNNMKLGLITNGKGQFQMDNVAALGIEKYFDAILISEWEGCKKPEPQIFEKALRKLNVSASESLFVGDHPDNDVKAAENAGMKGIWKRDEYWGKIEADYIINDLSEIPIILKEAGKMESELLKIFDDKRNPIGVASREEVHKKGFWHETFQCWFVSKEEEKEYILLQKRSSQKKDYPNLLDITSAGHLLATETVQDGIREIKEEIGIDVSFNELISLGIFDYCVTREELIDKEIAHVFLYKSNHSLENFVLQEEEVSGMVKIELDAFYEFWLGKKEFVRIKGFDIDKDGNKVEINRLACKEDFVPHENLYYETIIRWIYNAL